MTEEPVWPESVTAAPPDVQRAMELDRRRGVDFRSRLDPEELCAICGRRRGDHWGRRTALAPQKLGHQFRPVSQPKAQS